MNNNRQLMLAWRMYAEDNGDQLPYAYAAFNTPTAQYAWVPCGNNLDLSLTPTQQGNWDVDNTIKKSPLWTYCGNSVGIWHCPADRSMGQNPAGQKVPRPRSMSMNIWVGGRGDTSDPSGGWGPTWKVFRKQVEMIRPGPSNTFVFLEEREDSINDGFFVVMMDGYPDISTVEMVDWPASYHGQACAFAFADGHCEIHKWQDKRTYPPINTSIGTEKQPGSKDVYWMQDHSTRLN
jgi:prepilin-type processing-associated H-X9-DG protein